MRIRLQGAYDDALLRASRRQVDAVVAELPATEDSRDLSVRPLSEDVFVIGCRRGHPLVRDVVTPERLLAYPWVLSPRPSCARARLGTLFVARGLAPPEPALETESTDLLLRVVAASDAPCSPVRSTFNVPEAAGLTTLHVRWRRRGPQGSWFAGMAGSCRPYARCSSASGRLRD